MLAPASQQLLAALLDHDLGRAQGIVDAQVAAQTPLQHIYSDTIQEALYEVGRRWEANELTVAQEHYVSAAAQQLMSTLHAKMFQTEKSGRRLVATALGGNLHSIGIRMVADVFELGGWITTYLGSDVAAERVVEAVIESRCDVLAISATLAEHVPSVAYLIGALRQRDLPTYVLVGGAPFNRNPLLWRDIGANGHAVDPQRALELVNQHVAPLARGTGAHTVGAMKLEAPHEIVADPTTLAAMSQLNNQLHDVTRALGERNAELERLQTQLDRMMGVAAHDLRSPLMVIACHAELLRDELGDHESLDAIEIAGNFMKQLLDDLLDVARVRANRLVLQATQIDLAAHVRDVVALLAPIAGRKSVTLALDLPDEPVCAAIDAAKMQQLINNLVGNAIQYSPLGAEVRISLTASAEQLRLAVRDQGIGIEPDELAKVFRPFTTGTARGTAGEKSTGLGLAIVEAIVIAHAGRVWVESELGRGSTFCVEIPR